MTSTPDLWTDAEVIFRYTRADALRDGVLVDVSAVAAEAGVQVPVAVTAAVWHGLISPPYLEDLPGQDVQGRLWDLLWMFTLAARLHRNTRILLFDVLFLVEQEMTDRSEALLEKKVTHTPVTLKAICGPGDRGEPVITLMLPEED